MKVRPTIGIFQAEWDFQSHTASCAIMLAQAGYLVDLFLYETQEFYEVALLDELPNIQVHRFKPEKASVAAQAAAGIRERIKAGGHSKSALNWLYLITRGAVKGIRELYRYFQDVGLLPEWVLEQTHAIVRQGNYKCLIGVEKKGLIWAGMVADRYKIPYMYYSLELYTKDHPVSTESLHARRTKRSEAKYHRKSLATIIQDPERAQILLKDNAVDGGELFYVPVSVLGGPYTQRSSFLQSRFDLPAQQKIILQFGWIRPERFNIELVETAQQLPADWTLVFHGYGADSTIQEIRRADLHQRVILSLEMLPTDKIRELIASAHIGLALYGSTTANEMLTAFSSEKVALYLQCGLPIIAFNYPGYRRLIDEYGCGAVIETIEELPEAVSRIMNSYEEFSSRAHHCFTSCYDLSRNFQKVIERIGKL